MWYRRPAHVPVLMLAVVIVASSAVSTAHGEEWSACAVRQTGGDDERQYAFVLNRAQREKLVAKVRGLKLGQTRQEVLGILGPPMREADVSPKKGAGPRSATTRTLTYYVQRWRWDEVNTGQDQDIELLFDGATDRLTAVVSTVPELESVWRVPANGPGQPERPAR